MFKKFICLTWFVCVFVVFSSAQAQLKVDFGTTTSAVEEGFEAYTATNEVVNTFTPQSFDAFGTSITVALSWSGDAPAAAMQMHDRIADGRYAYAGEHEPLIQDWTGTDGREAGDDTLVLTLSGLPKGTYSWLSYHHDGIDQTGQFSMTLNDASGSVTTEDLDVTNSSGGDNITDFESITILTTEFTSNGTDDVTFEFTITSDTGNLTTAFFAMNGFEIEVLSGGGFSMAGKPQPPNGESDVAQDVILAWTPGEYVERDGGTHNVYFGTDFNDVNDGIVLLSEGQDVNTFDPGRLEFNTTYYWRVDEVNSTPDATVYRGSIWSFTTEPIAYKIPSSSITASASSQAGDTTGPENTINESGLDPNNMDLHTKNTEDMWATDPAAFGEPAWIQYDFDKLYKLHQMLVWNYNGEIILSGFGVKDVNIEYSEDGENWAKLAGADQFAKAPGTAGYEYNTTVEFNGVAAKSVRINVLSNWGGGFYDQYGLSEVRFMYIPVRASMPDPETDSNDILIDVTLSWKAGREAQQHIVSLSTDQQAVSDGNAVITTINETSYNPLSLDLGRAYYWRIDEVNNNETPTTWIGDIWSFRTEEYIIVEDFERYTDDEPNRVWDVWLDGWDDDNNGSTMGYPEPDFIAGEHYVETENVHGGEQSAPIFYNNSSTTYSEVSVNVSDLPIGTNWTTGSPEMLVLWFYGNSSNTPAKMYVKINNQSPEYYPGNIDVVTQPLWKQWNIDITGYNLNSITSLVIGFERADTPGGESMVFVDDICLYREVPPISTEEIWIEAESFDIAAPMQILDDDPDASGGQYITVEAGTESLDEPPTEGVASYTFEVEGGTYKIIGFVITPTADDDSFWVNIDGATTQTTNHTSGWVMWNSIEAGEEWHSDVVHSSDDNATEVEWTMEAGTYTLEIGYREDGALLDAIMIQKIPE